MRAILASVFEGGSLEDGLNEAQQLATDGIRPDSLEDAIVNIINFALGFVALIAVTAFIVSGFIFILGLGSDASIQRAKKIMIWSAVGIFVIVFSFVITEFIVELATSSS
ncbi:hypothetical protein HOF56_04965 [Candidatus Peribacteria bacterium]|jgi:hypothetical protein|nr:hypothetical protein [Candidatus Peribacteria bacterium]MBT4021601.1 hypothetical protein [Candidatus Peribacteria bacterium]MBT4240504.1 hypothetical protein [Candidatus Peribacteria bacterium]MBT4474315.1 hypothetical protein [Candidatus Peribacteria bacterium]